MDAPLAEAFLITSIVNGIRNSVEPDRRRGSSAAPVPALHTESSLRAMALPGPTTARLPARHLAGRLLDWLDQSLWRARQRDLEAWLAQATDHADLERRQREAFRAGRL